MIDSALECIDLIYKTTKWQTVDAVLKDPADIYAGKALDGATDSDASNDASDDKNSHHHGDHSCISKPILQQLDAVLTQRKQADADSSYVASLYHKGLNKILEKVGEEAIESIIAAKDLNHCDKQASLTQYDAARHELIYEVADVWFHTLVALSWFDIESDAVLDELGRRFGLSGIDEKAARTP